MRDWRQELREGMRDLRPFDIYAIHEDVQAERFDEFCGLWRHEGHACVTDVAELEAEEALRSKQTGGMWFLRPSAVAAFKVTLPKRGPKPRGER